VSRRRQQGAVADSPGTWYPDGQYPSGTVAGFQVPPQEVRPGAHLRSGHVRYPAGGLAHRQLGESGRHVAGVNRLDDEALLADSIGSALLVILHTLGPAERISFVLHDIFAVPFDDIAAIVGRSPAAARQLASRARRRVKGIDPGPGTDLARQRAIAEAFLTAARSGNVDALLETLDPDAVVRSNGTEVVRGAAAVAGGAFPFTRTAKVILPAVISRGAGLVTATNGRPVTLVMFTITDMKITVIDLIDNPRRITEADLAILARW
jgi:Sigma-70, region 4